MSIAKTWFDDQLHLGAKHNSSKCIWNEWPKKVKRCKEIGKWAFSSWNLRSMEIDLRLLMYISTPSVAYIGNHFVTHNTWNHHISNDGRHISNETYRKRVRLIKHSSLHRLYLSFSLYLHLFSPFDGSNSYLLCCEYTIYLSIGHESIEFIFVSTLHKITRAHYLCEQIGSQVHIYAKWKP